MEKKSYECIKCGTKEYTSGKIRTTGSGLSRFVNVQNKEFITVTCASCGYTDMYKVSTGTAGKIIDLFTN
ncbi:MAG: DNA-binding protein [Cenarchaeum symbiont of Oopsacas minuta]|nr:DNA-binding protein [Cenarchaeum symbiont of Oopsacas minuta]